MSKQPKHDAAPPVCVPCADAPVTKGGGHHLCTGETLLGPCHCAAVQHRPDDVVRAAQIKRAPHLDTSQAATRDPGFTSKQDTDWRHQMSVKQSMKAAGINPALAKKSVDELREQAARLDIAGRSTMKRAELEAAITAAKAPKPKAAATKSTSKPKAEREVIESYGDLKPGVKVRTLRKVDTSNRTEGFAGEIPAGTEGVVTELRPSGGGGVQVVFEAKSLGATVAIGARHFEVVSK